MAEPILTSWRNPDGTIDTAEITEQTLEMTNGRELVEGDGWVALDPAENDGRRIYGRCGPIG